MTASKTGVELQDFEFDAGSGQYRTSYTPDTTPPSMIVIALLVEILDSCPIEMAQLQNTVDTDALDALFVAANRLAAAMAVSFTYEGYAVTVRRDEVVAESAHTGDEGPNHEVASR